MRDYGKETMKKSAPDAPDLKLLNQFLALPGAEPPFILPRFSPFASPPIQLNRLRNVSGVEVFQSDSLKRHDAAVRLAQLEVASHPYKERFLLQAIPGRN